MTKVTETTRYENVTGSCRFIDSRRRTVIPNSALETAGIPTSSVIEWISENGCLIGRPVLGITVPSHTKAGKVIRKGR